MRFITEDNFGESRLSTRFHQADSREKNLRSKNCASKIFLFSFFKYNQRRKKDLIIVKNIITQPLNFLRKTNFIWLQIIKINLFELFEKYFLLFTIFTSIICNYTNIIQDIEEQLNLCSILVFNNAINIERSM